VDLDIEGFFDNLDHSLVMHAVRKHTDCAWMLLYIERWLKASAEDDSGKREARTKGTPQGGVISPLLANIFLHHAFDTWMSREHPGCPFERYADDIVIHCRTLEQAQQVRRSVEQRHDQVGHHDRRLGAQQVRRSVEQRLRQCKLEAPPDKTRIVYCRDSDRTKGHEHIQFEGPQSRYIGIGVPFLGYSFRPRRAKNRRSGKLFTSFLPAISPKAKKAIVAEVRGWNIHRMSEKELTELSGIFNPKVRGWVNYYGRYYPTALRRTFNGLNRRLVRWARQKYKRFRNHQRHATHWLRRVAWRNKGLFAHWQIGVVP